MSRMLHRMRDMDGLFDPTICLFALITHYRE